MCVWQFQIHVLIELYDARFLSTLWFNCRTWESVRKYDIDTIAVSSTTKIFKANITCTSLNTKCSLSQNGTVTNRICYWH